MYSVMCKIKNDANKRPKTEELEKQKKEQHETMRNTILTQVWIKILFMCGYK